MLSTHSDTHAVISIITFTPLTTAGALLWSIPGYTKKF